MYEDSNGDKINMIGACLILYCDINVEKQQNGWPSQTPILTKNRNLPHLTLIFLEFTPSFFGKESNKCSSKHNITFLNVQDNKDKFKIATKFIFFHLIYRSFESEGHVKLMLFIYVFTLLMCVGKLNRYGINYFVLFLYKCMYWYSVMHMSKIEIYKGKHNEVYYHQFVSPMNAS